MLGPFVLGLPACGERRGTLITMHAVKRLPKRHAMIGPTCMPTYSTLRIRPHELNQAVLQAGTEVL